MGDRLIRIESQPARDRALAAIKRNVHRPIPISRQPHILEQTSAVGRAAIERHITVRSNFQGAVAMAGGTDGRVGATRNNQSIFALELAGRIGQRVKRGAVGQQVCRPRACADTAGNRFAGGEIKRHADDHSADVCVGKAGRVESPAKTIDICAAFEAGAVPSFGSQNQRKESGMIVGANRFGEQAVIAAQNLQKKIEKK